MSDLTAAPNGVYKLKCVAVDGDGEEIEPRLSDWVLSGNTDSRTSIDNDGVLKIGPAEAGTLTVTVEGSGESGAFEVAVDPAGAPYWPAGGGDAPVPPTPATVTFSVTDMDLLPVSSPLTGPQRYTAVLQSTGALPADAQVQLTSSSEQVQLTLVAVGAQFKAYMLVVGPSTPDGATVTLTASGTGFDTVTKEYVVEMQ